MKKYKAYERDPQFEYALYSEDDDVCIYENENDAMVTKKAWLKSGANGVQGPFALDRSALDKAAPELRERLEDLVFAFAKDKSIVGSAAVKNARVLLGKLKKVKGG